MRDIYDSHGELLPDDERITKFGNFLRSTSLDELPEIWKCGLEQTEWICRSNIDKESKEAIIILTAKEAGPMDSMEEYEKHLNSSEQLKSTNNQFLNSIKANNKNN
jgi:hypothetical protein